MIRSFKSKTLRLFAETGDARKLSVPNARRVQRILNELNVAKAPGDMNLPGYRFHALKGARKGTFAVDASGNYRITFRWDGEDAVEIDLEDYH
ncbi:MAG TPA: type II toxin-antitoxin system RelE/ParE family toxin [Beijerinckiaceae bacterium]|nr:type II toxin-antitoxin system RelE/ParE family toxin [Beijerinckiaceae bacterium]